MKKDHIAIILTEMFKRVGLVYSPEFTKQDEWYRQHTWTQEEETDFKKWLVQYIKKNKLNIRAELEAGIFLLDYGWMTREGE